MPLQMIVRAPLHDVGEAMNALTDHYEIFDMGDGLTGLSVPLKVIDDIGEKPVRKAVGGFEHYDLWAGDWKQPRKGWLSWF